MGLIFFLIGAFGAAGAIENGTNLLVPIVLIIIGFGLMTVEAKRQDRYSTKMDRSTRLRYLP